MRAWRLSTGDSDPLLTPEDGKLVAGTGQGKPEAGTVVPGVDQARVGQVLDQLAQLAFLEPARFAVGEERGRRATGHERDRAGTLPADLLQHRERVLRGDVEDAGDRFQELALRQQTFEERSTLLIAVGRIAHGKAERDRPALLLDPLRLIPEPQPSLGLALEKTDPILVEIDVE